MDLDRLEYGKLTSLSSPPGPACWQDALALSSRPGISRDWGFLAELFLDFQVEEYDVDGSISSTKYAPYHSGTSVLRANSRLKTFRCQLC